MSEVENTILVVEDNPDNSNLARKILSRTGLEIHIEEDGESALSWCESHLPKLILMDISLPGIDGLEVTRQLKAKEAFAETPIIALTAHALSGWDEKCLEAGCTGYITKPIIPKEFLAEVTEVLEKL